MKIFNQARLRIFANISEYDLFEYNNSRQKCQITQALIRVFRNRRNGGR
jgi:hypothetical protein